MALRSDTAWAILAMPTRTLEVLVHFRRQAFYNGYVNQTKRRTKMLTATRENAIAIAAFYAIAATMAATCFLYVAGFAH